MAMLAKKIEVRLFDVVFNITLFFSKQMLWLIQALASLFHHKALQESTINLQNPEIFQKVAQITVDLSEDMYCDTLDEADGGDNFFTFLENPRYKNNGKLQKSMPANSFRQFPKVVIYDWNGDESLNIPKSRIIALRGTHSTEEWAGNFDMEEVRNIYFERITINGYFHENFAKVGADVFNQTKSYMNDVDMPIIITGHSRGAALSEIVSVIAKKYFPNKNIYCFAYAPAPSMALDANENNLQEGIYGFVNSLDPIPRLFVEETAQMVCGWHNILCRVDLIKAFAQLAYQICLLNADDENKCFSPSDISGFANIFFFILRMALKNKTKAVEGLRLKKDKVGSIIQRYLNGERFHIQNHIGVMYEFKWIRKGKEKSSEKSSGCINKALSEARLQSTSLMTQLHSASFFKNAKGLIIDDDHNPRKYRHAIYDDVCSVDLQLSQNSMINNDEISNIEEDEYPLWFPNITDGDDLLSCQDDLIETELDNVTTSFSWNSFLDEWQCEGKTINCDPDRITYLKCFNTTHMCTYDNAMNYDSCIQYKTEDGTEINRCISPKEEKKKSLSGGAIAGIVIGCAAFVAIVAGLVIYFIRKKKSD